MSANAGPALVDAREAELLAIARALVTPDSYPSIEGALATAVTVKKIGPRAMAILESTLAKGIVRTLARSGGAKIRRRPGSSVPARVFDVRPPPALAFGRYTFELLRWLTQSPLNLREPVAALGATPDTHGDQIVAYLVLRLVEGRRLERLVAAAPALRCPLTWLGFARSLARHAPDGEPPITSLDTGSLALSEDSRTVVESLVSDLTSRWIASTTWNEHELLPADVLLRIGRVEHAVLGSFLDGVERAERWDLATFLIDAGARTVVRGVPVRDIASRLLPSLRPDASLRIRTDARRQTGALFRALARLEKKRDAFALVHFIDEGYDAAQATLSSWEPFGKDGFARAADVISILESLDPLGAPNPDPSAAAPAQKAGA
jgi:hypothetical protein